MAGNIEVIGFFSNTDSYIKGNPVIGLRRKIIRELTGDPEGKQILDIGCGDGTLTMDFLKNNKITFLDVTPQMINLAKLKAGSYFVENAQFLVMDVLDFTTDIRYDIIVCTGLYAHIRDVSLLTGKISELLNNEGVALIQFTDKNGFAARINRLKNILLSRNRYKYAVNTHSTYEMLKLFRSFNLNLIMIKSYWPVSPFFSLLNDENKRRAIFWFYMSRFLSKLGSEKILFLKKSGK